MSFHQELEVFAGGTNRQMRRFSKQLVMKVLTKLIEKSPVGDPMFWKVNDPVIQRGENYDDSGNFIMSKLRKPIGYVGGRFRGNWQYGHNAAVPQGLTIEQPDQSGARTRARIEGQINTDPGTHYLTNNLPYAKRIEDGWSHRQAPYGVVSLTVAEFAHIAGVTAQVLPARVTP